MLTATTAQFTVMVEDVAQTFVYRLTVDLPGSGYDDMTPAASALSFNQQLDTDVPDGTRLVTGSAAASANFTLSGLVDRTDETKTAEWLFNPYSTDSPLYRSDAFKAAVTIELGLYPDGAAGVPELVRVFTGRVDDYSINGAGEVEFTCIDRTTELRSVPQLPPVVTQPPYNAALTSEFAMDYLLRASTNGAVSSWPARRASSVLAVGLRSSLWPEVGSLATTAAQPLPTFTAGPWGTGLRPLPAPSNSFAATRWNLTAPVGATFYVETLVQVGDSAQSSSLFVGDATIGAGIQLGFDISGVTLNVFVNDGTIFDGGQMTAGGDMPVGTPHKVGLSFTMAPGSKTFSATIWIDGHASTSAPVTVSVARSGTWTHCTLPSYDRSTNTVFAGVQVTTETLAAATVGQKAFVPTAVLDPSLNPLDTIPALDDDPWATLQTIAAAELGAVGYLADPDTFRFWNRDRLRAGSRTSTRPDFTDRTITAETSLKDMTVGMDASGLINRARVGYTPWTFATVLSTVYAADDAVRVPRNGTKTLNVTLDTAASNVDTSVAKMPDGAVSVQSYYRASRDKDGLNEFTGALSFTVTQPAPDQLNITIRNGASVDAWLVSPANYVDITAGSPLLRIAGYDITAGTETVVDWQFPPAADGGAAGSRFGEIVNELTGNPWIQDADTALNLATRIVCSSYRAVPDLNGIDIVPDPRLQLGDRVLINDPDQSGVVEYARIVGVSCSLTANEDDTADYTMTIDARAVTFPGGWILGVPGRSELGQETYV